MIKINKNYDISNIIIMYNLILIIFIVKIMFSVIFYDY
jgi:hypothetical protein